MCLYSVIRNSMVKQKKIKQNVRQAKINSSQMPMME